MTDLMICNNISSVSLSIRSPGDELYESAQQVGLLPDGLLAEGEDGAVDDRHDVEDLVEEVGHVLRRQVRRGGGGGGLVDQRMFWNGFSIPRSVQNVDMNSTSCSICS